MRYYPSSYCTYDFLVCLYTNDIDSYMGYEHLSAILMRALPSYQKRAVHEDLNTVSNIRFYPISNSSKSNLTITLLKPIQLHLNCSKLCFTAIISIVSVYHSGSNPGLVTKALTRRNLVPTSPLVLQAGPIFEFETRIAKIHSFTLLKDCFGLLRHQIPSSSRFSTFITR